MKYIKIFEDSTKKLSLKDEFQSVIDLVDEDYCIFEIYKDTISFEFFENEIEIDEVDDLDKAKKFSQLKTDIIEDIKLVCKRLEEDGYFIKIKYKLTAIIIEVLQNNNTDKTIQGWLIPQFGKKTNFDRKEVGKEITRFTLDVRNLKKWFVDNYGVNIKSVVNDHHNTNKIMIFVKDFDLNYEFCKNFTNSLKSFIFKDIEGNLYEPNNGHMHLVPKSEFEGARFDLYNTYTDNRPIYSINISCNRYIIID